MGSYGWKAWTRSIMVATVTATRCFTGSGSLDLAGRPRLGTIPRGQFGSRIIHIIKKSGLPLNRIFAHWQSR